MVEIGVEVMGNVGVKTGCSDDDVLKHLVSQLHNLSLQPGMPPPTARPNLLREICALIRFMVTLNWTEPMSSTFLIQLRSLSIGAPLTVTSRLSEARGAQRALMVDPHPSVLINQYCL